MHINVESWAEQLGSWDACIGTHRRILRQCTTAQHKQSYTSARQSPADGCHHNTSVCSCYCLFPTSYFMLPRDAGHILALPTCGIVGHWLYVLMASLSPGLYTSSSTLTTSYSALSVFRIVSILWEKPH